MRGFTFSQMAVIILVLVGLIVVVIIAAVVITDFARDSGMIGGELEQQTGGAADYLKSCYSRGGTCTLGGCGGKLEVIAECENPEHKCCV
jgi:hypothetical protein